MLTAKKREKYIFIVEKVLFKYKINSCATTKEVKVL